MTNRLEIEFRLVMITKKEIIKSIDDFTEEEMDQLSECIQYLKYKRIIVKNQRKQDFLLILKDNGILSFEELARKIKTEIPFARSGYDNIYGGDLRKWISVSFKIPTDQAKMIIETLKDLGLLHDSGLGNYK
jgi:hypothetical protein